MLRTLCVLTAVVAACTTSPAVTVIQLGPGQNPAVQGDVVKVKRSNDDAYGGLKAGYYVIRSHEDWGYAWGSSDAPRFPASLDPARTMLVIAIPEGKDSVDVRIQKVLETGTALHVWVKNTKLGDKCLMNPDRSALDAVIAPRIDKPFRFYIAEDQAESCGEPPEVKVQCRIKDTPTWSEHLPAQPGETVDCEMTASARGKFAVVDSALRLGALPSGSATKLAYTKGTGRATFPIDVWGTYTVRGEAMDESGRMSNGVATVDALPPNTSDVLVQLVWTNFDASDDPETFPRVKLRAIEELPLPKGAAGGPAGRGRTCSADTPRKELCEIKSYSAFTQMKIKPALKNVALDVLYMDERADKGPRVCVQLYFGGARTGEKCDPNPRDADERWTVGTIDVSRGAFSEPSSPNESDGGAAPSAGDSGP